MTDQFIGEVQLFGFNYAPYQWATATGQTVPLSQYSTLFALIGTFYGGNGQTNFQLPNLVNRTAVSQGTGTGLSPRTVGETFGENAVSLITTEMPLHNHSVTVYTQRGTTNKVGQATTGGLLGSPSGSTAFLAQAPNTMMSPQILGPAGQSMPHENRQPFLGLNYCIALYGVFPSFN